MKLHMPRVTRSWLTGLVVLLSPGVALSGEVVEYFHLDAMGNVRAVTNQAGQVVERHDFYPFGEECTTGPCAANLALGAGQPKRFTGKERDSETGLDYFGARYYQARIGRFTTVDPVYTWRDNIVDPQRWNRYAYAKNNPLRFTDPDGKETTVITVVTPIGTKGGIAFHSALRADNKGDPFLYDPSGGYLPQKKGGDALLWGEDADLGRYIRARTDQGELVETITFQTTPEQEAKILEQAMQEGDRGRPFGCATNVCAAIKDIGPFKPVEPTGFPARLSRQVQKLPGGERQVYEPPKVQEKKRESAPEEP